METIEDAESCVTMRVKTYVILVSLLLEFLPNGMVTIDDRMLHSAVLKKKQLVGWSEGKVKERE